MKTTAQIKQALITTIGILSFCTLAAQLSRDVSPAVFASSNPVTSTNRLHKHLADGDHYMRMGRVVEAIAEYDNAIASTPQFAEALIKRAIAKYHLGRINEADEDYKRAISLNPFIADMYGYKNRLRKLTVIAYDPAEMMGRLAAEGDVAFAESLFEQIADLKKSNAVAEALSDVQRAIRNSDSPSPVLYKLRGNLYLLLGRYFKAEHDYGKAIQLDPEYAEAYHNRGIARMMIYSRGDACWDFQESARLGYSPADERLRHLCTF